MTGQRLLDSDLRTALKRRVEETSLRDVAAELGMRSFTALQRFISGETDRPHRKTRVLMIAWYYRRKSQESGIPPDAVENAKAVLHAYIEEVNSKAVSERRRAEIVEDFTRLRP